MKETYHIGQINVGQNFCRIKLFVGQNFRHLRKVSSLLSYGISSLLSTFVRKFCPFSKFEITLKNSIRYFFRDSLFLYHKNKKNIHILYFSTIMLNSISLSSINGGFLFLFTFGQITSKQSSSTSSSSESRICGSILFFCFHYLTILIILYYDSNCFFVLNLCFIVVLRLKFSGVKLSKKVLDFLVC